MSSGNGVRILLTSFEPFGGMALNSSLEVGRSLAQMPPAGTLLDWIVLPVVAGHCVDRAWQHLEQLRPHLVLAMGQATGSPRIRLEDRAVNCEEYAFADNAGNLYSRQPVIPGGPGYHRTTVAIERLVAGLLGQGLPVEHSLSAGTYVCNHTYYHLLHRVKTTLLATDVLFVHLPVLPAQFHGSQVIPSMALPVQVAVVNAVIRAWMSERDNHNSPTRLVEG